MRNKIFLSTLYNLCIFGCIILGWTGITDKQYVYIAAAAFGLVIFVVLKIKLLKDVRNTLKP
ncbi:MAG: hypothetical protein H7289_04310 [Mucilaginibacter sp.]|nr:hypothetical protein [Mucilaginibacter sp.]